MADASVFPNTIGGFQTLLIAFFPIPIMMAQDGGRILQGSWVGSGVSTAVDSIFVPNGSSVAVKGQWYPLWFAEDHKGNPFNPEFQEFYALGSTEPHVGLPGSVFTDVPTPVFGSLPITSQAYQDNAWNIGEAGPEESAVRNSTNWVVVSTNPAATETDTTSVKSYPDWQLNFYPSLVPISQFQQIRAYADTTNPQSIPSARYEGAWDIYGHAHTAFQGITLECMFWTYNHGQDPHIGSTSPIETGIDLNKDGKLWDLYMTPDTYRDGGVSANYSYGIWYLQDAYQESVGWVDILAGLRYFVQYYVVASGPGAPSNPLDIPLVQLTRGWEICSTNYTPLEFRLNDHRLQMS